MRRLPVQSVTTAHPGRADDLGKRQRNYLLMMGFRIACLPLAVVTSGWLQWAFLISAVVLPYIAVVIANAIARPSPGTLTPVTPANRPALPASSAGDRESPE